MNEATVYATVERRINLGRYEHETITIGVSKIPVTASDSIIRMAMQTADRCVELIREELRGIIENQTDGSALEPHYEDDAPPACHECGTVLDGADCPTCNDLHQEVPQEVKPIPKDDEVWTHVSAFGVTVELPDVAWMLEPISEVNKDGEGGGQLRALNTALGESGFKGKDRHWASTTILRGLFPSMGRPVLSSLRDLTKYEASILLEVLSIASAESIGLIREATSKAKGQLEIAI